MDELKDLVKAFHTAGIQVIFDVVFNHTGEGDADGPVISFRGLDNKTYYLLAPNGDYLNFSGCGNTLDCNHPVVRDFVLDCLRYWAAEYHVDGFRFDLASVLGRDSEGNPLPNPPLLESIAHDPVLAHCELIAEAWDAGGLYQVGNFPSYGRWMEWNGKFRDAARRFLRGDDNSVGEMVQRILGSPDLYKPSGRKPAASVNFITCHDGFTLADLFSYSTKRNIENGEENRDGDNNGLSELRRRGPTNNRTSTPCASAAPRTPSPSCSSARACRCSRWATKWGAHNAATTTLIATTLNGTGSNGPWRARTRVFSAS